MSRPQFSPRLESFLEEFVQGKVPNAGCFCGYCYTPLVTGRSQCSHCGHTITAVRPIDRLPSFVVDVFQAQRRWEGQTVRLIFYSSLLLGIFLSALAMAFLPFWWNMAVFMSGLAVAYIASANIANTLGDALGYRWGQRAARRKWQQLGPRGEV